MRRVVFVALLAGCTVGPDYQRPDVVPLPGGYLEKEVGQDGAVAADWWKLYSDATLDELVEAGRKTNADLRQASARVQEAEGVLKEVRGAYFPEVTAGYQYQRTSVSTVAQPPVPNGISVIRPSHTITASTSFELDFWGKFSRATESARAALLSSRYSRDVVEMTLVSAIAQSYFALRSLDAQITVLDASIRVRQDSLEIARARLKSGLASELDVYQAQGALSDAMVQRRDAQRARALVEHQIAQLTGRLELKIAAGDLFTLPLPPLPPAGLPSALLERRPDIRQAEEALAAQNALIGVARAQMFPSISLTAAAGAQSAELGDILTRSASIWSLGAGITAPIFDAGRRAARVDQATARRDQAVAGYQRAIESGFREVADALVNVRETHDSEAELAERLDAARRALALSQVRYESGYSPYLEVLDAQRTANDAEIAFVRNRQARLAFSVDLMKALGGGWVAYK